MKTQTRRDFIATSAKGAIGITAGLGAIDNLLANNSTANASASSAGNNAKQAGSVISLPKGGGAVKGIGETFQPNPFTGTANISVPVATSPGRSGFGPQLSLQYSSGNGNGSFGMGWSLSVPQISRKTEKGIPRYNDNEPIDESEKDTFILSGAEDLVLRTDIGNGENQLPWPTEVGDFSVTYYRPRTEGLFAKIEKWERTRGAADEKLNNIFWKITTKENITNIYGLTKSACITKPENNNNIFQWFLELTFNAKGNCVFYQYKRDKGEDIRDSIYEHHRKNTDQIWQVYLKTIRYGNNAPFHYNGYDSLRNLLITPPDETANFFNVVFDYGEHGSSANEFKEIGHDIYEPKATWLCREDPFSTYRSGFEIRTYRQCQRVLMFHNIPGYDKPTLVKSTDYKYIQDKYNKQSMLVSVIQRGYRRSEDTGYYKSEEYYLSLPLPYVRSSVYHIKSLPPLELTYSEFNPEKRRFKSFEFENNEYPSTSLTNSNLAFVDLFGTGLIDLLETTPGAFYFQKNLGYGKYSARNKLDNAPAGILLTMEGVGFGDMNGNGQADLLLHRGSKWGFWESNQKGGWKSTFMTYKNAPSFSLNDPSIRLVDITGDGKSDILRTEDSSLTWFPCLGEEGWDAPKYSKRIHNLEEFPDVYFTDSQIRMADMTGDGLPDLVMIHEGRVDYWPNRGYGTFGKRITMQGFPRFGADFDPKRLFLADIDGSGPCDMIYVESGKVSFWFNQSGNSFSDKFVIEGTPQVTNNDSIQFADVLGNGSNCIIYSTDYSTPGRSNYWYLDFTGGVKPNVLVEMNNNLGAITRATYQSSTYFYLQDRLKNPWLSTLPFPVHVLEKVEVIDQVSRTKLVTQYKYHHGYYDGREREFRGFALVEQWDTEHLDDFSKTSENESIWPANLNGGFHVPPVYTKTWYHTGACNDEKAYEALRKIYGTSLNQVDFHNLFSIEYYKGDEYAYDLPNSVIDTNRVDINSMHEAYRALRGSVLRQEVYAQDESSKSKQPYTVTESNFIARLEQPKGKNKHAVFFVYPNESLSYHYERNPKDPRIGHEITLTVDNYGNVKEKVTISYPRRIIKDSSGTIINDPQPEQLKAKIIYSETLFITKDKEMHLYCHSVPYESKSYEVIGLDAVDGEYFVKNSIKNVKNFVEKESTFRLPEGDQGQYKRLLKWQRTYFKKDNASAAIDIVVNPTTGCPERNSTGRLTLGEIEALMLPYEQYQATFGKYEVDLLFGKYEGTNEPRVTENLLKCAGFVDEENYWWKPSGQQAFDENQFYLPVRNVDPLGNETEIKYELQLLLVYTKDALGNETTAKNDLVVLQPFEITDPNQNRTQVAFDAFGMVAGTANMGKEARNEGDTLDGFNSCLDYNVIRAHINNPVTNNPHDILKGASTVILSDLWRNKFSSDNTIPVAAYTISREIHHFDLKEGEISPVQRSIIYSDGFGREIQTKKDAEPEESSPDTIRWIASGWKIFNNKGKPVMQFEPFFSDTHEFEYNKQIGVSTVIFYDPLERVVITLHPNHTYEKVTFDAWMQETWDTNDAVLLHPKRDEDIKDYVAEYFKEYTDYQTWFDRLIPDINNLPSISLRTPEQQAAIQTMKHAGTPTQLYLDNLSRPFLTIQNNGEFGKIETKVVLDIEGNELEIIDPRGIHAFLYKFAMTGEKVYIESVDAGEKISFTNVLGNPVHAWDANKNHIETLYDRLNRPEKIWVEENTNSKYLIQRTIYGESIEPNDAVQSNLHLQVHQVYDGAGLLTNEKYDFKGNLLQSTRKLLKDYKLFANWNKTPLPELEEETFTAENKFDALSRIVESKAPDNSIQYNKYNQTGLLKSVSILLEGETGNRNSVNSIDYNAKAQQIIIEYGNETITEYTYEPETFRLSTIISRKNNGSIIQDLQYTYDPTGNITQIRDGAFETVFDHNERIDPKNNYTYDAIYRLIEAKGREHEAMTLCNYQHNYSKHTEFIPITDQPVNNGQAIYNYVESYTYDKSGNITLIDHNGKVGQRVRNQTFNSGSNLILTSKAGCSNEDNFIFTHDANGNILRMPHLPQMNWDYANRLVSVELNIKTNVSSDRAFYTYDAGGQRVRKVIEQGDKRVEERIYVGGYEIYRKYSGTNLTFKRSTLHVMDDTKRIALIERKLEDQNGTDSGPESRVLYQLDNHLGSSLLELDENANEICYEEYYPYGGSAYLAGENETEVNLKRYRYSGKEKDDETGLYYYGARYYISWMGRWLSVDPIGMKDGLNLYLYAKNNPINSVDKKGTQSNRNSSRKIDPQLIWDISFIGVTVGGGLAGVFIAKGLTSSILGIIAGGVIGTIAGAAIAFLGGLIFLGLILYSIFKKDEKPKEEERPKTFEEEMKEEFSRFRSNPEIERREQREWMYKNYGVYDYEGWMKKNEKGFWEKVKDWIKDKFKATDYKSKMKEEYENRNDQDKKVSEPNEELIDLEPVHEHAADNLDDKSVDQLDPLKELSEISETDISEGLPEGGGSVRAEIISPSGYPDFE